MGNSQFKAEFLNSGAKNKDRNYQERTCGLENRTLMSQRKVRKLVKIILQKVISQEREREGERTQIINNTDSTKRVGGGCFP